MGMKAYLTIFVFVFIGQKSIALSEGQWSVGSHQIFAGMLNKVTTNEEGKADFLGTHHVFPIYGSYTFEFGMGHYFVPMLTTSALIPRKSGDGFVKESLLVLTLPYGFEMESGWDFITGPTYYKSTIKGEGGTYTDPGGGVGYVPTRSSNSTILGLTAGLGKNFDSFRFETQLSCFGCLSNEKRSFNLSLLLGYVSGGF